MIGNNEIYWAALGRDDYFLFPCAGMCDGKIELQFLSGPFTADPWRAYPFQKALN